MSKELEEIKSIITIHFGALGFYNPTMNDVILKDRDKVLNYLNELESRLEGKNINIIDAKEIDSKSLERFITDICNKPSVIMTEPKDRYYRVFIRQYSIIYDDYLCYVKLIKTDDLYHWIGYYYSTALEHVRRIDYQEIDEETFKKEKPRTYYKGELI